MYYINITAVWQLLTRKAIPKLQCLNSYLANIDFPPRMAKVTSVEKESTVVITQTGILYTVECWTERPGKCIKEVNRDSEQLNGKQNKTGWYISPLNEPHFHCVNKRQGRPSSLR